MPKAGLLLAESLGGHIDLLNNQRAWIMVQPIPFVEVESAWARVVALQAPMGTSAEDFFAFMRSAEMVDMSLPFSVQTPQWANYEPLSVKYTKRVSGQYFGLGRNNAHCRASFWRHTWTAKSTSTPPGEPLGRCRSTPGSVPASSPTFRRW